MGIGPAATPDNPTGMLADDADSTQVSRILENSEETGANTAIVFFTSEDGPLDLAAIGAKAADLGGPAIPSEDGTSAITPLTIDSASLSGNSEKIKELRAQASADLPEGITAQVTGPAAISADLSGVFEGANFLLLGVTGLIVAVLLIFTYRSPVLWIIPLLVIGIADRVAATSFTWVLDALGITWNESTAGILSVLVFGAGTNYALLLISRYRDELHRTPDRFEAMSRAWVPTAKTVLASGLTVILGVACLMFSHTAANRGLGAATMIGIVIAMLFALFALPGALVTFGRWVFWPRPPKTGTQVEHRFWDRVGALVRQNPRRVLVGSLVALAIACIGATQISIGLKQEDQFIDTPESIIAAAELSQSFPGQDATPAKVLTKTPEAVNEVLAQSGVTVTPADPVDGWSLFNVSGADTEELRNALAGTDALVGGSDAELKDNQIFALQDALLIFPMVLLIVFLALVLLLRSFLAPLIMVATVLLTNVAALGLGWWISTGIFGFDTYADTTPLYAFVFLVALGIDYSIFLITRTREEARKIGTPEGVLTALSSTGGVITSAGILLAAVFAALGVLPLVALAQVGIVIFIGVLLDTLVVRTLLIPSVVQVLGEKFWWPAKLDSRQDSTAAKKSIDV
ncbi:MMPL family transporter [Corynebacterium sp. A21]|uniref:MMPL family transporter n=1 Tax=Corynebacterium sp. A21 TaxID=3457318 RepID=UPI003FCF3F62